MTQLPLLNNLKATLTQGQPRPRNVREKTDDDDDGDGHPWLETSLWW